MDSKLIITAVFFLFTLSVSAQSRVWKVQVDAASLFSSPRAADLNKDGVLDVVLGGGVENQPSKNGVIAIDGISGEILWAVESPTQIYTSALFQDINGDTVVDVFIGGRAANYFAIDGATGKVIWRFFEGTQNESRQAGFLNFFGTQFVDDADGDGLDDLLLTNGGDYLAKAGDTERPSARLMIVSSATGKIIQSALMPDRKESYYAPHLISIKGKQQIVFGTGGETLGGSLYYAPFDDFVKKGSLKNAVTIISDTAKGFILNSVCADLNNDLQTDIITASMNGEISAYDAVQNKEIWSHKFKGKECYVTPSLGMFNNDKVPDVFTIIATGTFPQYSKFEVLVIDGKTGEIILQRERGFNQFSPGVILNFDEDNTDEVVYLENKVVDPETYAIENKICIYDIEQTKATFLGPQRKGMSMASAPLIVDLGSNGNYEIIVCSSTMPKEEGELPKGVIECITLPKNVGSSRWPGYLGPNNNGELK